MEQQIQLNDHNKQEYPPMHTAEHLLNAIYFLHVRQRNRSNPLKR